MKRITAVLLVLVALALVALAWRLYDPPPKVVTSLALSARASVRRRRREPTRLETIRAGLAILVNSVSFALVGV